MLLFAAGRSKVLRSAKILRNVVTDMRALEGRRGFVQCSEDLRLRVWSPDLGKPELEVRRVRGAILADSTVSAVC